MPMANASTSKASYAREYILAPLSGGPREVRREHRGLTEGLEQTTPLEARKRAEKPRPVWSSGILSRRSCSPGITLGHSPPQVAYLQVPYWLTSHERGAYETVWTSSPRRPSLWCPITLAWMPC
jgi:hypothetical protein